jgi:hypothetical protein
VSRWLHSSARCQAISLASTWSICAYSCAYSSAWAANRSSQGGQAHIGLDALEQRIEVRLPLGGGKAELACISLLRAIDFEFNIILPSGRAASPGKTNASRMGRYCLAKSMTCG